MTNYLFGFFCDNVMKSFKEYLIENKKTYEFKIKVADQNCEDFEDKLTTSMEKFSLVKLNQTKRIPISKVPVDFPNMKNVSVTVYDLEINYPTTADMLENYIAQTTGCLRCCIKVQACNEPSERYQQQLANGLPCESQSDQETDPQRLVGERRVSDFLKTLEAESKERNNSKESKKFQNLGKESLSALSPVGSAAQKGK